MKKILTTLFLAYLKLLAKIQLWKIKPTIIGVTGSAGKTTTRNVLVAILQDRFKLKVSYKANSETGLPLNILGLTMHDYSLLDWLRVTVLAPIKLLTDWQRYNFYLAEMAIDAPHEPKNMSYLLKIVQPTIGIFLNAQPLHSEGFDDLVKTTDPKERRVETIALIAQEKGLMIKHLPKTGTAILNTDDVNVWRFKDLTSAKVIGFGQNEQAKVQVMTIKPSLKGTEFIFRYMGEEHVLFMKQHLLPDHYAYSFASALAVGLSLRVEISKSITKIAANFKLPPGRSSLIAGINGAYILDSSYNASNQPTMDAIKLVDRVTRDKKYALLGDMRELGLESQLEHEKLAALVVKSCDRVMLVGPQMKKFVWPILKKAKTRVDWVDNAYQAADILKTELSAGDMLLVKGSQNTLLLEIAVEKLMAHPEQADQFLCRRGAYWDKQRAKLKK